MFHPEDRPEAETEAALHPDPDQYQHRDSKRGIEREMRKKDKTLQNIVVKVLHKTY